MCAATETMFCMAQLLLHQSNLPRVSGRCDERGGRVYAESEIFDHELRSGDGGSVPETVTLGA